MPTLILTTPEHALLRETLESNYRAQHREGWEVKHCGGVPAHLEAARKRLATLATLLEKSGTSAREAMRPVTGEVEPEEI